MATFTTLTSSCTTPNPKLVAAKVHIRPRGQAIVHARTCYDHLAGRLGVALTDSMQRRHLIAPADNAYTLTQAGRKHLETLGLDIDALRNQRRAFARPGLDWTERRPHLAGALGAGIAHLLLQQEWLKRLPSTRAVRVTDTGKRRLRDEFALNLGS
jgi:hypothetical protein